MLNDVGIHLGLLIALFNVACSRFCSKFFFKLSVILGSTSRRRFATVKNSTRPITTRQLV